MPSSSYCGPWPLSLLGIVRCATDEVIEQHPDLAAIGPASGMRVRWNLHKLVGEYARHNGHADLIRETIDGQTGE